MKNVGFTGNFEFKPFKKRKIHCIAVAGIAYYLNDEQLFIPPSHPTFASYFYDC